MVGCFCLVKPRLWESGLNTASWQPYQWTFGWWVESLPCTSFKGNTVLVWKDLTFSWCAMIVLKQKLASTNANLYFSTDAFVSLAVNIPRFVRECHVWVILIWRQQFVMPVTRTSRQMGLFSEADENSRYDHVVRWSRLFVFTYLRMVIISSFTPWNSYQRNGHRNFYWWREVWQFP